MHNDYVIFISLTMCIYQNTAHLFCKLTMARTNEIAPEFKVNL